LRHLNNTDAILHKQLEGLRVRGTAFSTGKLWAKGSKAGADG